MTNVNFEIGAKVQVTMTMVGKADWVFESEVMDNGGRTAGVWVDHPELRGEDMLFINLSNPNVNKVELVEEEVVVNRRHDKAMELKDAHKALDKAFRWEEDEIKVSVKIYDCFEDNSSWEQFDDEQSYDVEIAWALNGEEYTDCLVVDSFYSTIEEDEVALNGANQRAKAVLRTVKGWFKNSDLVVVTDGVEVYHA